MGHLLLIRNSAASRSAGEKGRPDAGTYATLSLPSFLSTRAIPCRKIKPELCIYVDGRWFHGGAGTRRRGGVRDHAMRSQVTWCNTVKSKGNGFILPIFTYRSLVCIDAVWVTKCAVSLSFVLPGEKSEPCLA